MNETKHQRTLRFTHQDGDHLDWFLRVPPCPIQYGNTSINGGVDGGSYLIILGGIDKEMDCSMEPHHDPIDSSRIGYRHAHTI